MNKTKKSISIIIEILLIFSIMLAVLAIFFKVIVLNKNTYTDILNKNNTYEQVKESIYIKIDALLSTKNINYDIKESIITEDDVKREADNVISGFIQYLKTGENNIKPIDSEIYKQRVSDILHSIIGGIVKPNTNELSFNDNLQGRNIASIENKLEFNTMLLIKDNSKDEQDQIEVEKLMTQSEAEARVREILKQKGLTEEQAIEKATKKGITEEQALRILAGYGITIDDKSEAEVNKSSSQNSNDNQIQSKKSSDKTTGDSKKETSSNSQTENTINQIPDEKSTKSELDKVLNKLVDEAGSLIEKEVKKINMDKVLESSIIQKLAKITSIIYKMFWIFMILPIILMTILIKINGKDFNSSLKSISNGFLLAGLILFGIFFCGYALKVYEKFNINIVYLKDVVSYTIKHFLMILSTCGIATFIIGLLMFIPTIKKNPSK